jgi:WD40 repeat protein
LLERTWKINTAPDGGKQVLSGCAGFSADGRRLAVALPEGGFKVWELDGFREIFASADKADQVQWSPDGLRLLTVECPDLARGSRTISAAKLWDVDLKKQLCSRKAESALFSRDGQRLALVASAEGLVAHSLGQRNAASFAIQVVDATSGTELATFVVTGPPSFVFAAPDRLIATAGTDIQVWDSATRKQVFLLKGHRGRVQSLAVSPDGTRLASVGGIGSQPWQDNELILWEMATGSELMRQTLSDHASAHVAFSPDGHRLAVGRSLILDATPRAQAARP